MTYCLCSKQTNKAIENAQKRLKHKYKRNAFHCCIIWNITFIHKKKKTCTH